RRRMDVGPVRGSDASARDAHEGTRSDGPLQQAMRCPDLAGLFPNWGNAPWHEDISDRDVDPVRTARWQDSTAVRADSSGVPYYVIGKGTEQVRAVTAKV